MNRMSPAAAIRDLEAAHPDDKVKATIPLETGLLMHNKVDLIVHHARMTGLTVEHTKTGGWFTKNHSLRVEGRVGDLLAVLRWLELVAD